MTPYLIAERVFRMLSGGDPSDDSGIKMEDIKHVVIDEINKALKIETISINNKLGDDNPSALVIATYEGVQVEAWGTYQSRALLPAVPVSLPMNAGVWWVSPDADDATRFNQFIPMQSGQWSLIKDFAPMVESNLLLGNKTYEVDGKYLVFPTNMAGTTLMVKLVLVDVSNYGDWDLLPIPADYVSMIIDAVLNRFGVLPQKQDDTNDANTQK